LLGLKRCVHTTAAATAKHKLPGRLCWQQFHTPAVSRSWSVSLTRVLLIFSASVCMVWFPLLMPCCVVDAACGESTLHAALPLPLLSRVFPRLLLATVLLQYPVAALACVWAPSSTRASPKAAVAYVKAAVAYVNRDSVRCIRSCYYSTPSIDLRGLDMAVWRVCAD
jgi:hypothetical protein